MASSYPIPAAEAAVELRFKNSRFIGATAAAATVEGARAFIARRRRDYPDAGHHVYAFAVGYGDSVVYGRSDDGEPAGTAGRPLLAVVQGAELGDVVVVITRYFGGTKLGTGGLVKAYTETAQAVLAQVPRQLKVEMVGARLVLPYGVYKSCRMLIEAVDGEIDEENFAGAVDLRFRVSVERLGELRQAVREATAGRISLESG